MTKKQRVNGESTRAAILDAATHEFTAKGFAGASMGTIAKRAQVNSALLYHHFQNKQTLWKAVKSQKIAELNITEFNQLPRDCLTAFLQQLVTERLRAYCDPQVRRLLQWQRLEDSSALSGTSTSSPEDWLDTIVYFQQQGDIRNDWPAETILMLINSLTAGAMLANPPYFTDNEKKVAQYQRIVIDALHTLLREQAK